MRFRVLGSTELVANSSPVVIGSERQRRLLAVLAMHCPDPVRADRLVDAVWAGTPPANESGALATVVTRLRHSLDDQEAGTSRLVVSRPPGYVLDVPAESIDANRFADLALNGRRHLAEGDPDAARRMLSDALRMWRGRPYAEFEDEPWARGEAQRLQRLWVAAREADIEARLVSGLHAEVIGDIEQLVDEEPYSDGPRGLLMRALFAGGRQNDAVRAFQDYRRLLTEQAGLEPGRELLGLEQRILANDPTLLTPAGRPLRGYRLHEQLESTERGAVFRATQPGLERTVAIEVIREDIAGDADFVRSFELQGRALAQLEHAHVAPIYDCWREPGGAYLVRRLLSGGTLADPEVRERLGPRGLARVRSQVRSALDVAHQAGLVHGSIEAHDIQLDEHDTAYLANFRLGTGEASREDDVRSMQRLFDAFIGPTVESAAPVAPPRVTNPYRGLASFRESDVDVFFGRSRLVEATLATLARRGAVFVVGPSGSGKSSLVRAGVVPALAAGEIDGSESWFVATMVPGTDPFAALEAAVLRIAVHPPGGLRDRLRDSEQPLADVIQRVLPQPAAVVLVIDQFEELFTVSPGAERERFLERLGTTLREPRSPLRVIATVRADFYDHPLAHTEIASVVTDATVPVDALSGDELRAAIARPAGVVGLDVEPELVGRLVADASGRPGALPLLEYTLTRLVETRRGDTLTLAAYLATGGLTAAIGSRAEEIHDRLDEPHRQTCRRLFGRLVDVDTSTDARRRARLSELRDAEDDPDGLDTVAERFVEARLLLTDLDPRTREPTLEVAHEALFREWPRLARWIGDDRATITTLRHLSAATRSWRATGHDSELYRGARLATSLDLVAQQADRLTPDEHAFVAASRDLTESEHRHQQRTNRRLRGLLVTAGALLVAAAIAGLVANSQRTRADDRAAEAERQAVRANDAAEAVADAAQAESAARATAELERLTALARSTGAVPQEVAVLAALEAHRLEPSSETLNALHWSLTTEPGYRGSIGDRQMGGDITVLDDGRRIVTHTIDTIEVWDVDTRTQDRSWPFPGADDVASHAALRSTAAGDGSLLVAGAPGVTTVIETGTGDAVATISHSTPAVGVALSPDSSRLAIAFDDGTVEVRDIADSAEPVAVRASQDASPTLRWDPRGPLALGTTGGDVVLWDPDAGEDIWTIEGSPATGPRGARRSPALLFSSEGDRLVVANLDAPDSGTNLDSTIVELATDDRRPLATVTTNMTGIGSLSWLDQDQTTVVTSGLHGSHVEITDLDDPGSAPGLRITNFDASAVLPELGLIVTEAGLGLDIHSVDESNPLVQRLAPPPDPESAMSLFSTFLDETGTRLLTNVGLTGTQVIELGVAGASWQPFTGSDGAPIVFAMAAANGRRVLTAGAGGFGSRDWNGDPLTDAAPPPGDATAIAFITLSPEGDRAMMTIAEEDVLLELDPRLREIARLPRQNRPAVCCATPSFSTDGALFARVDRQGGTELYDARTGERIPFRHQVEALLFGPRDTWFATVDDRGTIHLHDQQTGERIGRPMVGNRGPITSLRPTYDQRRLAAIGADGTIRVWDLETMNQLGRQIETTHPGPRSWSADGRFVSVYHVGDDGIGRFEVWNFDTDAWPEVACELAGRNMTEAEWQQYGPRTIERRRTCPQYPL